MAVPKSSMEPEITPTYVECFTDIYNTMSKFLSKPQNSFANYSVPMDFVKDMMRYGDVTRYDVSFVLLLATSMTIIRMILTKSVFLPIGRYFRLTELNKNKLPESCWKAIYYTIVWSWSVYWMVYPGKHDFYWRPLRLWNGWYPRMECEIELYLIYVTQFSFYLHSIYATLYMDRWRRDSIVMIFHHVLTLVLVGFSYAVRYHKVGVLLLLLHDFEDVILEYTKINVYFKIRGGKTFLIHDIISTVGFIIFSCSWFVARLYWFPLKVLYSAGVGVPDYGPEDTAPFYFFFNCLLWVLQILNAYWFLFIIQFLFRVATGRMNEVDDIREMEVEAKYHKKLGSEDSPSPSPTRGKTKAKAKGDSVQNGALSKKKGRAKKTE